MSDEDKETCLRILKWYATTSPRRVDIIGDFGGKQLFLVDGDSLLRHSIATSAVDYDSGFQLLHAIFAVESFLGNLKSRGCNFHVVFFDNQRKLCVPSTAPEGIQYKYHLTRTILFAHLHRYSESTRGSNDNGFVFSFPSVGSREFNEHLAQYPATFLLCHDGRTTSGKPSFLQLAIFQYMIHQFLNLGHSVALIDSTEFKSSRVFMSMMTPAADVSIELALPDYRPNTDPTTTEALSHLDFTLYTGQSYRELITLLALANMLQNSCTKEHKTMAVAMIFHSVIIGHTRLTERPIASEGTRSEGTSKDADLFLRLFCQQVSNILESDPHISIDRELEWDIFDIIDGRLFLALYAILTEMQAVPAALVDVAKSLIECVENWANVSLQDSDLFQISLTTEGDEMHAGLIATSREPSSATILPFSHKLFNEFLAPVQLQTAQPHEGPNEHKVFRELTHWHNARKSLDPKRLPKKPGFFARKRAQQFMADTLTYAASLTNATGKILEPKTIVAAPARSTKKPLPTRTIPDSSKAPKNQAPKNQAAKKKTGAISGKDSARDAALSIQAEKLKKKDDATFRNWCTRTQEFSREQVLIRRFQKCAKYFLGLTEEDKVAVGSQVSLYLCDTLYRAWENEATTTGIQQALGIASLLFNQVMETSKMLGSTRDVTDALHMISLTLGIQSIKLSSQEVNSRRLSFTPRVSETKNRTALPSDPLKFQLEHCGPFLERTFDSRKDPRVPFEPDAWQREVLDGIDSNDSLFIIAPTSSGKTFISFYAMEKTLRSDDDGVLVYVAPTKALVNQIAAEIQARFAKTYHHEGKCVWAIHTRDYRVNNPNGCQVLVTVPHVLQIMLLSPSNLGWAKRIKRVIFDEVHCIGQADDGIIWEQLLLMAPCPIIALSATVGNPEEFCEWLKISQTSKGFNFKMITHDTRYSDLRVFRYVPPKGFNFTGLSRIDHFPVPGLDLPLRTDSRFQFIHPVAAIMSRTGVDLEEISLEPRDAIKLWESMNKFKTEDFPLDASLNPARVFSGVPKKSDVLIWIQKLKLVLAAWMQNPSSPFNQVRSSLNPDSSAGGEVENLETQVRHDLSDISTPRNQRLSVLALLYNLHEEDGLPAILFNYDRVECENALKFVLEQLESAESEWKESSSDWHKTVKDYNLWKASKEKKSSTKKTSEKRTKEEKVRDEANADVSRWESFDPDRPLDKFSFGDSSRVSQSELEEFIASLSGESIQPYLFSALKRGIAVHHAGMNRRYRQAVEILFRKGYLTAVIATGTLALGINMPCKTVAFIGDSAFLTTLNYKQGAGRAGRRGFDLLGNVVFTNMSMVRIHEIMSSRLPDLKGHFPLTTTLVLRILGFIDATGQSDVAAGIVKSLLTQNRLYLGGAEAGKSIQHHLRFSVEYLQRQHLLSADGRPINFAGLVGHLYFTETAVFAFHFLLKDGYFHRLCSGVSKDSIDTLRTLGLVMAHLFNRIPVRSKAFETADNHPGQFSLPQLPADADDLLIRHNKETLGIFKTYASTFIDQYLEDTPDRHLPLTQIAVGGEKLRMLDLPGGLQPTKIRSPFSALSGHSDDFASIHELCANVRSGVFLEESAVPYIPIWPHDMSTPLNSYIYDFLKHGDYVALSRDNKIKQGDVWFLLRDFSLVLATIIASLTNFIRSDAVTDDEEMVDLEDMGETPDELAANLASKALKDTSKPTTARPKSSKKKVAESWDDVDDEEEDEYATGGNAAASDQMYEGTKRDTPVWEGDGKGLVDVLKAFTLLKEDFDEKFMKAWA